MEHVPKAFSEWDFSFDKLVHFVLFAVLCVLTLKGNLSLSKGPKSQQTLILGLILLFGALTETIQYFIPNRTFSLADLAADGLGAVFGAIIFNRLNL